MVVVVWTNLLHQLVVGAVEGDEDADDFERLGAQPGHVALRLLLRAALRRVVGTQRVPGALLHLLVLHPAVEELGVLRLESRLLLLVVMVVELLVRLMDLKLHGFCRRHKTHGHVALPGGVVAEVDAECPIAVIHDFSSNKEVELYCLDVGVEVAPAEHLLELPSFDDGSPLCPGSRISGVRSVVKPVPLLPFGVGVCIIVVIVQIQGGEVLFVIEGLGQQSADGERLATFSPVGFHFGFRALSQAWILRAR